MLTHPRTGKPLSFTAPLPIELNGVPGQAALTATAIMKFQMRTISVLFLSYFYCLERMRPNAAQDASQQPLPSAPIGDQIPSEADYAAA